MLNYRQCSALFETFFDYFNARVHNYGFDWVSGLAGGGITGATGGTTGFWGGNAGAGCSLTILRMALIIRSWSATLT